MIHVISTVIKILTLGTGPGDVYTLLEQKNGVRNDVKNGGRIGMKNGGRIGN